MLTNNDKINIIIQARMDSTRLSKKVLLPLLAKPLILRLIERLKNIKSPHNLIIAIPDTSSNDPLESLLQKENILYFRGDEQNVLARFYKTCQQYPADYIVRITSDCPLMDPAIVDVAIKLIITSGSDYVSNTLSRTYPRGMDVEAFTMKALTNAYENATSVYDKEHVTPYLYHKENGFKISGFQLDEDFSFLRLTVDTKEDYVLIEKIFNLLYPKNKNFDLKDMLNALQDHPEWIKINAHIQQKK